MNDSNEKEPGDWNKYEIVCKGDTIEVTINGQRADPKAQHIIHKGDRVLLKTPGGGGYGVPPRRKPEDTARDRLMGYVSSED